MNVRELIAELTVKCDQNAVPCVTTGSGSVPVVSVIKDKCRNEVVLVGKPDDQRN